MELKLILSGVPKGESYWGPDEDVQYLSNLYSPSEENKKYVISLRDNGKGRYAYYHYLVYNIINDSDGRIGSYFGITLRLDKYCTDYISIYYALDMIYRKKIIGKYLKPVIGERFQYTFIAFDKIEAEILNLESELKTILGSILNSKDIMPINAIPTGKAIRKYNLFESNPDEIKNTIGQYGTCVLSEEHISRAISEQLKEAYDSGVRSKQPEIDTLQAQLREANASVSELQEKASRIENTSKHGNTPGSNHIASHSDSHGHHASHHNHGSSSHSRLSRSRIKQIIAALCGGLIGSAVTIFFINDPAPELPTSTAKAAIEEPVEEDTTKEQSIFDMPARYEDAVLDVENYTDKQGCEKGMTYIVNVNGIEAVNDIELKAEGATAKKVAENKFRIYIAKDATKVRIAAVRDDTVNHVIENLKSRTLNIK